MITDAVQLKFTTVACWPMISTHPTTGLQAYYLTWCSGFDFKMHRYYSRPCITLAIQKTVSLSFFRHEDLSETIQVISVLSLYKQGVIYGLAYTNRVWYMAYRVHKFSRGQQLTSFSYCILFWMQYRAKVAVNENTRMWANAQRDGHPAEYRWRPLFNAAKFGWRPLPQCRAVTLPRREPRWN